MSWRKSASSPCAAIMPPIEPMPTAFWNRTHAGKTPVIPRPTQKAAIRALFVHTTAAKSTPGS
ncbi:Uncharacterised protein [Mycobacteroides abscessus]|nr:Uncharacterised protein [Mycobacteroides abscessus]